MRIYKSALILTIVMWLLPDAHAQNTLGLQEKLDSLVNIKKIPGIIVGISQDGQRKFKYSGYANKESGLPMQPDRQLEIGSITKTFTAYLLCKTLQDRKINDTSSFIRWLPDSVQANTNLLGKSFLQLLNHTSGLQRLPSNLKGTREQPYIGYIEQDLYSYLATAKPDISSAYAYSNLGMGLAGQLACVLSQQTYAALVDRYFVKPLNLTATGLEANSQLPVCTGYLNGKATSYWQMDVLQGAGGIKSTPVDMLTYLEFILASQDDPIIKIITTPTVVVNERLAIARGWHWLLLPNQQKILWHNGGTYGFSTFCGIDLATKTAVFVAVNSFNANDISDVIGINVLKRQAD
jgi:CubicO group peptidase (beta-lactamase class C family)